MTNPTTVLSFLALLAALGMGNQRAVVVDRVSGRRDLLRFDGVVDCAEQAS